MKESHVSRTSLAASPGADEAAGYSREIFSRGAVDAFIYIYTRSRVAPTVTSRNFVTSESCARGSLGLLNPINAHTTLICSIKPRSVSPSPFLAHLPYPPPPPPLTPSSSSSSVNFSPASTAVPVARVAALVIRGVRVNCRIHRSAGRVARARRLLNSEAKYCDVIRLKGNATTSSATVTIRRRKPER